MSSFDQTKEIDYLNPRKSLEHSTESNQPNEASRKARRETQKNPNQREKLALTDMNSSNGETDERER